MKKWFLRLMALVIAAVMVGSVTTACAGNSAPDPTYAPAAYGQMVAGVGFECYFVDDIQEVAALERAGLCPSGSIPTVMPLVWQQTYWAYYSSPAYYSVYIPVGYRAHYISYTTVFSRRYSSQITLYSSRATYKGSNGTTVRGSGGTSSLKFGSGTSSTTHGGGARGCAESLTVVHMRGGGGGSSGGGHGGGSRGSTSSGSKSGSGSRSGSGC